MRMRDAVERLWRVIRRRRLRRTLAVVHRPGAVPLVGSVEVDPLRSSKIRAFLEREGILSASSIAVARPATIEELCRVHTVDYLESLQRDEALAEAFPGLGSGELRALRRWQRGATGATIEAMRRAVSGSSGRVLAVNLGGGFHHALRERAQAFCLFNDVAAGIEAVRAEGFGGRILVVDLDLHQGDGTRAIYRGDDSVFTLSIHAVTWDERPAVAALDVALGAGVGDATYLEALRRWLPLAWRQARPDLVVYVAGVDIAHDDALGNWRIGAGAIVERDVLVDELTGDRPLVWLLAGGYGEGAWRYSARGLAAVLTGRDAPIPDFTEEELRRMRAIARSLPDADLGLRPDGDGWGLREEDIYGDLAGAPVPPRFLGAYTTWGLEVALERYGILAHLRSLGYRRVRVEIDTNDPLGDVARVRTADEPSEVLIEVVARIAPDLPGMRLLRIEWLLLQHPRARPDPARPLLPGQHHPGLGCLRPITGMLAMAAERLGLDGLSFHPAHYHMAVIATRASMVFVDPSDEGRLAALRAALEGLSLAAASRALDEGQVCDARTGRPVTWQGGLMVMPLSDRLRARVHSRARQQEVEAAAQRFAFRLCGAPSPGG